MDNKLLSILIPTVTDRAHLFFPLLHYLENQLDLLDLHEQVEVLFLSDNKEQTIGEKREELYQAAEGLYAWQIDDDDSIASDAITLIMEAIKEGADCITFEERCIIDNVESRSNFSLNYPDWAENQDGFDHVRTPFFKTPIKTAICRQVPIPHIRFGEDHEFARAIKPLLTSESHIDRQLYFYIHNSTPFNERYGIK